MLRILIVLFFVTSCSLGTVKRGAEAVYAYDPEENYSSEELKLLAPKIIADSVRNPPQGKLNELFHKGKKPIKRVGIIVFESLIQPTRGGLAGEDQIYLGAQGKQLLTEKFHTIWDQVFLTLSAQREYVRAPEVKKILRKVEFGVKVEDHVKAKRSSLAPDDIFFLEKGKKTTTDTLINPRGMRDVSFMFVPATELMGGPKWSEHNKHFVNEVAKKLGLDAAIIVMSEVSWTAARVDKHTGEVIAEGISLELKASTLIPHSEYRERAQKIGLKDVPNVTICYRHYTGEVMVPALLTASSEQQNFDTIEKKLLNPLLKSYSDLTIMMVHQMIRDLRETH